MSTNRYLNEKGQLVGFSQQSGNTKTFFNSKGGIVGREFGGRTYDSKGSFKGNGEQGMRLYGEKKLK
jgi:hypothetical protein